MNLAPLFFSSTFR